MRAVLRRLRGPGVAAVPALLCLVLAATSAVAPEPAGAGGDRTGVVAQERREARGRPNIVVVMADDMRVDELRFAPRVRRLVGRHGVTFRNSFSPFPLCCPARASFLTGQLAHNHRVYSHERPFGYGSFDDSRTLATALKAQEYRTGYVGKYLNGYGRQRSLVSGGPSHTYVPRGWTDWRASLDAAPGVHGGTYNYMNTPFNVNGRVDDSHRGEYSTDVIGDFARRTAGRFARSRRPFFLYVNFVAPHFGGPPERDDPGRQRTSRGEWYQLSTPARPRWVRGRFDHVVTRAAGMPHGGGPSERDVSDKPAYIRAWPEPTRRERRAMRESARQRAEAIFAMDRQVGRLIRKLKRSGEWRRTVLAFTSDNGYFQGEHRLRQGKIRGLEPSLRVPLVVTGPGFRGGSTRDDPVTTVDLSATVLALAGAAPPRPGDGRSRLPTLRNGDQGWTRPVLSEAAGGGQSEPAPGFGRWRFAIGVRTARYSYIRNRSGKSELYDLRRDPAQLVNVIRTEAYTPVRRLLAGVWEDIRNCEGSGCHALLPPELRAEPPLLTRLTRAYWREIGERYGYR